MFSLEYVPPGGGAEQRTPNETHIVMKAGNQQLPKYRHGLSNRGVGKTSDRSCTYIYIFLVIQGT